MRRVELVLRRLKVHSLYVCPKKCYLFKIEVEFLGLIAGKNGIRANPAKLEVIKKWPKPENITELRGFMRLVQFFKRFIRNFLEVARPLKDLARKDKGITDWDDESTRAFEYSREALKKAPILVAPD